MAKLDSFDNMPELEPIHPRIKTLEEEGHSNQSLPKEKKGEIPEEKDSTSAGRNTCIGHRPGVHKHEGAGVPGSDLSNASDESCHGKSSKFSQSPHQKGKIVITAQRPRQSTTSEESEQESRTHAEDFGALGRKLAAEALEADMQKWITFYTDEIPPLALQAVAEDFLAKFPPSKVKRSDGFAWIYVESPDGDDELSASEGEEDEEEDEDEDEEEDGKDIRGLKDAWIKLNASGELINFQKIQELAVAHGTVCGKWMVFKPKGIHVDLTWERIFRATIMGRLGISAKVSPVETDKNKHVICVYNEDFTNKAEVRELESRLRAIGIRCTLKYKPDVFTYLGVYSGNEWNLKPVMYVSDFDLRTNSSVIVSVYD